MGGSYYDFKEFHGLSTLGGRNFADEDIFQGKKNLR